jgi:hypothetical protein
MESFDRRDISELLRWVASGAVFCSLGPLFLFEQHPWAQVKTIAGDDGIISMTIGLSAIILIGSCTDAISHWCFGQYVKSRMLLASLKNGVTKEVQIAAGIGGRTVFWAYFKRSIFWTYVPGECLTRLVGLRIHIAAAIAEDSGIRTSPSIGPLSGVLLYLAISQPRIDGRLRQLEIECSRTLDRLLLFLTFGTTFLLLLATDLVVAFISAIQGDVALLERQKWMAVVFFAAILLAKFAAGRTIGQLLVCLTTLSRETRK